MVLGKPLGDMPLLAARVLTAEKVSAVAGRLGLSGAPRKTHPSKKPGDITFVRNRILYAKGALDARGTAKFGLRHIRKS